MKKLKLPNGLKILLVNQKNTDAVTALILVKVGSEYESKEINGISHFLEHMCFKGTKKRPDKLAISKELDSLGAEYNAFTSKEYTGYFAKSASSNFQKIFDIISDIYLNSILPENEIEKERRVILEEINMNRDLPQHYVWNIFMELAYGNQPAGWDIAGTSDTLKKIERRHLLEFRQKFYQPTNTLIVIAGNFKESTAVLNIQKTFGNLFAGPKIKKQKTILKKQKDAEIKINFKKTEQTHLIFGFECSNLFDKRKYALEILSAILGGGMSSRLFQKIREKMGLAYYIYNDLLLFSDHGLILTSAGVQNEKIKEAIENIWREHQKIINDISAEEIAIAKKRIKGQLILNTETSDELASFYGGQEIILGKTLTPAEIIKKIEKVNLSEIKQLAKEIFKKEKINIAVIGPIKNLKIN